MKKTIALFTVTCLALMLGVAGCGYNQPGLSPSPYMTPGVSPLPTTPVGQTGYRTYPYASPLTGQTGMYNYGSLGLNLQDCQAIAKDIASLPNVRDASCVVSGNTCLVGATPQNNTNNVADINTIKNQAVQACNRRNLNVSQVLVTTDPTLCQRIKTLMTDNFFGINQTGQRTGQTGVNQSAQAEFNAIRQQMSGNPAGGTTTGGTYNGTYGGTTGGTTAR